jgi:hypothetical protein
MPAKGHLKPVTLEDWYQDPPAPAESEEIRVWVAIGSLGRRKDRVLARSG